MRCNNCYCVKYGHAISLISPGFARFGSATFQFLKFLTYLLCDLVFVVNTDLPERKFDLLS